MLVRGSRWSKSDLTFGPVGRVVATVLLLVPLWWFLNGAGIFGLVGVVTYGLFLVPWALRDIWRPVRRTATADEELQARLARELARDRAAEASGDITDRETPPRW
jgi:hypothetical protein